MKRQLFFLLLGAVFVVLPVGFITAQTEDTSVDVVEDFPEDAAITEEFDVAPPPGTVSCFDYYTFGSVQANLTAPITTTVSGTPITFTGSLANKNPYPIVDGALFVKVFKSRGSENDGNGPDVVDQFFVQGDIVIPANGSVPVSFQWKVPSYAVSGEYSIATFFTTSRKFNLLGLSFTDDVVGNTVPFRVQGEQSSLVKFDKSGVTIQGEPYYFAAFPPRVDATSSIEVKARVRNTGTKSETVTVLWTIYQWDVQLRENVVQEESRPLTIPANGSADTSFTVQDTKYPVYLAVATLAWKDTKSVIGARFVRSGVDRTRINFPSITSFPLEKGAESTLFSCLHNSGESAAVSGGSLDLTLADRDGNVIHEYQYNGDITGAMMGVASAFIPEETYDYFTLTARLFQDGEFVDEANLVYDCEQINPTLCNPEEVDAWSILGSTQSMIIIGLGIIVLLLVLWIYRRVSRKISSNTTPLPPI